MNKATSLYLDAVRFLAALVVLASHAKGYVGGFLWRFDEAYGDEAVTVFFVLSGFVIAHATATRETTMRDYAIARVSRIYSVALPALVLTALADQIGHLISPKLYDSALCACTVCSQTPAGENVQVFDADHFIASALFVNELWGLRLQPGSDGPYWSLGFEVWYYVMFAVLTFCSGQRRILLVLAVTAVVGPGILAMWPLWLLGVWAYRRAPLTRGKGIALFGVSLLAWGAYEAVAWRFGRPDLPIHFLKRPSLLQDYIVG